MHSWLSVLWPQPCSMNRALTPTGLSVNWLLRKGHFPIAYNHAQYLLQRHRMMQVHGLTIWTACAKRPERDNEMQ